MAQNNIRIISNNRVTAIDGNTSSNALNDYKSKTITGSTFTVTTSAISGLVGVVLMLPEYTGTITMTVTGQSGVTETTTSSYNSQVIGYGGGKYIAKYFTLASPTTSFTITLSTSVKVSKIIIGNPITLTYNIGYGISVGYEDQSSNERLQNGDVYNIPAPRNKTMSFALQYIHPNDKFKLFDLAKQLGKSKPVFVSAFPDDDDKEREQMFSIYGRFNSPGNISFATFEMYASNLQVDEI